jgi:hypothetical protein
MIARLLTAAFLTWVLSTFLAHAPRAAQAPAPAAPHPDPIFQTSHDCLACHNGLSTPSGEDVSIGASWRASMMANSARDPYWQASVRREITDHPDHAEAIEDECSICHMPMARTRDRAAGQSGRIFAHLPLGRQRPGDGLALDGVSCTLCHQLGADRLGTPESFTGGFTVTTPTSGQPRTMFGPFAVDTAKASLMRSATGVRPGESTHVQQSEMCATCHTLYTSALGSDGQVVGSLPEQVPYLEWRHSAFRTERSCQSCHMPEVDQPTPISSVLGEPRPGMSRHTFLGGNFFMLRMLNRFRSELAVEAPSAELEAAARATVSQLQTGTATVSIAGALVSAGRLTADVDVSNLTGHKLPTGYPSRRTWLHVRVRDGAGRTVFESGAPEATGAIRGNDSDLRADAYEPHYTEVRTADQVQIYESVMADQSGSPTTGLLLATRFVKDNRLLPRGFDKATAPADVAVHGAAATDADFAAGLDRVRYSVDLGGVAGPIDLDVELWYQPIAFRWAQNLKRYESQETTRFVSFYDSMAGGSGVVLARASTRILQK